MSELNLRLDAINPVEFYGINNSNLNLIEKFFPKLKIIARGELIKAIGDEEELKLFETKFSSLTNYFHKYQHLTESDVNHLLADHFGDDVNPAHGGDDVIVYGQAGILVKARTPNQRRMVEGISKCDMLFAIGPAGTGKTYTAVALAVRALKNKEVKRIILTRPAVEAGEHLGFLPGDVKEKLDPYLQPLYDALFDMIPHEKLVAFMEAGIIQIAPLAFMRGRTLDHAFVILDEAQNATESQLKMFLTRMGRSAKFIVTGDVTQIDLPKHQPSGLLEAVKLLSKIKGIEFIFLDEKDAIRHELVQHIVNAYEKK